MKTCHWREQKKPEVTALPRVSSYTRRMAPTTQEQHAGVIWPGCLHFVTRENTGGWLGPEELHAVIENWVHTAEAGLDDLKAPIWAGDLSVRRNELPEVSEEGAVDAPIEEGALSV